MKRTFRKAAWTLAAFAAAMAPSLAWADTETVHLIDGSVYAGELVEKVPNDHVTLKLATGEVRRFEWSSLAPPPPAAPPAAAPGGALAVIAQPPPLPPRPAHVRFTADAKGALLMRVDTVMNNTAVYPSTLETETPVCYAPCSSDVDANARYYVRGAYITRSRSFSIPEGTSALTARTGSSAAGALGATSLTMGILSTLVGAIVTPVAFATSGATNGWDAFEDWGVASLVAGGALILIGIPLLVASATHVGIGDMDVARGPIRFVPGGIAF